MRRVAGRLFASALLACALMAASSSSSGADRLQLELGQQREALNSNLQQSLRGRTPELSTGNQLKLDQLDLEQRIQQRQLEAEHRQRSVLLERSEALGRVDRRAADLQQDEFAAERSLQAQRFELERQRLLRSMPREPLQPRTPPGQLIVR